MKKVISLIAAAAMFAAVSGATIAADNNPTVFVDGREIFFDDQAAVIKNDRTLVPARGVFEAMGAKVDWDGEKRQVQVTSADEQTIVRLVIDDADMKVYDMSGLFAALMTGQDFHAPETIVTLDVPAQIMNDRTMVPLRAISEAVDAQVDWNGEAYCVEIVTKDAPTEASYEGKPAYTLSTSADKVAEGETVDVLVNASNIVPETFVAGVSVAVSYDSSNFEFIDAKFVSNDKEVGLCEYNDEYTENLIRVAAINIDPSTGVKTDDIVMKLTFKSINGQEGLFSLVDGYTSGNGLMTYIQLDSIDQSENGTSEIYSGNDFFVDTTPVVVNAAGVEATAVPKATTAPEATTEPEATTASEASEAPKASAEPTATSEPTATPEA